MAVTKILSSSLVGRLLAVGSLIAFTGVAKAQVATYQVVSDAWTVAQVRAGTGVGNGSLRSQEKRSFGVEAEKLRRHEAMEGSVRRVGESLSTQLRRAEADGFRAYIYENPDQAFCSVLRAMKDATSRMGNGPMTKILLDRGIKIANELNQGEEVTDCLNPTGGATLVRKTRAAVLFEWVKMTKDVAEDFDVNEYLPYRNLYNRCFPGPESCEVYGRRLPEKHQSLDYREFELKLVKLASRQLKLINQRFSLRGQQGMVVPFGSYSVYMNFAATLSGEVVLDLLNNLYGSAYERSTIQLYSLHSYLRDGRRIGPKDLGLFQNVNSEIGTIAEDLSDSSFFECNKDCVNENGWVTPDSDWVKPRNGGQFTPGFSHRDDKGSWVHPGNGSSKDRRSSSRAAAGF